MSYELAGTIWFAFATAFWLLNKPFPQHRTAFRTVCYFVIGIWQAVMIGWSQAISAVANPLIHTVKIEDMDRVIKTLDAARIDPVWYFVVIATIAYIEVSSLLLSTLYPEAADDGSEDLPRKESRQRKPRAPR